MTTKQQLMLGIGTIVFVTILILINHIVVPYFSGNTEQQIEIVAEPIVIDTTPVVKVDTNVTLIGDDEMPENSVITNWYCYTDFKTEQEKSSAKAKISWKTKELYIGGEQILFDKLQYTSVDDFCIWEFLEKTSKEHLETKVLIRRREMSVGKYNWIITVYNQKTNNDMAVYTTTEEDCVDFYAYWKSINNFKNDI